MGSNKGNVLRIETPDEKDQRIARLEAENALLRQKIDALSHRFFGNSSEQLDPDQPLLLLQGIEEPKKPQASSDETSAPEEADDAKRKKTKAKNHSRIKGLDTLETEEQIHLPAEYEANPDAYDIIGQEVTELLDYRPARCIRQIITRVKVRPKNDSSQPPILAPAPTTPLVGGLPSFNLVTDLIIGKYADHLPLYRQQGILQRSGISIPRDTLNHWTLQSLGLLVPIAEAIQRETLASDYLQGDEPSGARWTGAKRRAPQGCDRKGASNPTAPPRPWHRENSHLLLLGFQRPHPQHQLPLEQEPIRYQPAQHPQHKL